jgi:pilus assembly protein CpaE
MSPVSFIYVRLGIKNQEVKEKLSEIVGLIEGLRIDGREAPEFSDLLILEAGEDIKRESENIASLLNSGVAAEVFLTSSRNEPEILIQALRAGIKEFFSQPLRDEEVKEALLKFRDRRRKSAPRSKKNGEIIDVITSKGGVGGTTVAVNLATSLIELEGVNSVALMDMEAYFGEIPLFLEIEPHYTWGEIVNNISRLDHTSLMNILSKHSSGIYVLPAPDQLGDMIDVTQAALEKTMNLMRSLFDFVVIDSGQPWNAISRRVLDIADAVLLVSVLTLPSMVGTKKLLDQLNRSGYNEGDIKLVINRYLAKTDISLKDVEKTMGRVPFWLIPNDYSTALSSLNQGKTLADVAPRAEISKNFRQLAAAFIKKEEEQEQKKKDALFGGKFFRRGGHRAES